MTKHEKERDDNNSLFRDFVENTRTHAHTQGREIETFLGLPFIMISFLAEIKENEKKR